MFVTSCGIQFSLPMLSSKSLSLVQARSWHSSLILTTNEYVLLNMPCAKVLFTWSHLILWREYNIITPIFIHEIILIIPLSQNCAFPQHYNIFKEKNNGILVFVCQAPGKIPSPKFLPITVFSVNEWNGLLKFRKCSDLSKGKIPYYINKYVSLCDL